VAGDASSASRSRDGLAPLCWSWIGIAGPTGCACVVFPTRALRSNSTARARQRTRSKVVRTLDSFLAVGAVLFLDGVAARAAIRQHTRIDSRQLARGSERLLLRPVGAARLSRSNRGVRRPIRGSRQPWAEPDAGPPPNPCTHSLAPKGRPVKRRAGRIRARIRTGQW
jgi:hypothetical protein